MKLEDIALLEIHPVVARYMRRYGIEEIVEEPRLATMEYGVRWRIGGSWYQVGLQVRDLYKIMEKEFGCPLLRAMALSFIRPKNRRGGV